MSLIYKLLYKEDGTRVKIMYLEEHEDFIMALVDGATEKQIKPEAYVKSGDVGCGKPGTFEWDETWINQLKTGKEIALYMDAMDIKIYPRGRLENIRKNAIKKLKEKYHDRDSK